jgi:hypothetical protein
MNPDNGFLLALLAPPANPLKSHQTSNPPVVPDGPEDLAPHEKI